MCDLVCSYTNIIFTYLYIFIIIFLLQELQDRAIKITKSTEQLVSSGHFAGEQATEQAYAILSAAADYVNDLDQYSIMLNRAMSFFDSARSVSAFKFLLMRFVDTFATSHHVTINRDEKYHTCVIATCFLFSVNEYLIC